ncbi:MAG: pro-sigmaK processing inhibitor BofA family protein [Oscillospiraceae bacterium]|nr:pro-sigmaK processing inhibitor BofA family protein [Oscillospiraceae bacterium]
METLSGLLLIAAVIVGIILLIKLLSAPFRWIIKLLLNALMGFAMLFVVNFFGGFIGIELGVNLINALIAGFLGIPGIVLLVAIKLFL